jgi:hypothetical protein
MGMEGIPPHEHPATPEQQDSFEKGVDHKPDAPDENLEPDFARGVRHGPEIELEDLGRFSEGIEEFPDSPEKRIEGDFATGIEGGPPDD